MLIANARNDELAWGEGGGPLIDLKRIRHRGPSLRDLLLRNGSRRRVSTLHNNAELNCIVEAGPKRNPLDAALLD
jgi:hypothetical protein